MRRFFLSALIVGAGSALMAAPVGDPAFPELLEEGYFISSNCVVNIRAGYEGDFICDARLKQVEEGSGRVDNYRQDTNSALATLNIKNWVDLYGVFGATRVSSDWRFMAQDLTVNRVELETADHFLWAVGGRTIVLKWGGTVFGVGARYNRAVLRPSWAVMNGIPISTSGTHLKWREWQVDFDVSHQIEFLVPYVGVKYSSAFTKIGAFSLDIANSGSGSIHMKNRRPVGLVLGCTITSGKYFMLNVEGRLIDESAATVVGDFRF